MRRVVPRRQTKFENAVIHDLTFVRKLVPRRQNDVILLYRRVNQKGKTERESNRIIKTKNNIREGDSKKKQGITQGKTERESDIMIKPRNT